MMLAWIYIFFIPAHPLQFKTLPHVRGFVAVCLWSFSTVRYISKRGVLMDTALVDTSLYDELLHKRLVKNNFKIRPPAKLVCEPQQDVSSKDTIFLTTYRITRTLQFLVPPSAS